MIDYIYTPPFQEKVLLKEAYKLLKNNTNR